LNVDDSERVSAHDGGGDGGQVVLVVTVRRVARA